jgi:hypothetical protein
MTNIFDKVHAQYRAARARLRAADDDVSRASRDRLVELMKLSERERFAQVDDPTLTPQDCTLLRRSIAATLPRPRMRLFGRLHPGFFRRRLRLQFILAKIPVAATVVILGTWATMSWLNTGELVALNRSVNLEWSFPAGAVGTYSLTPADWVVVVHRPGLSAFYRRWYPGKGYATANVDSIEVLR